ncbi:MAG: kelch repeat-containing protein, partial [Candidatus Promineifilaceae bacterium]
MRIRLILGLALVLATAALASAQGEPPTEPAGVPLAHEPNHMIAAEYIPVELTPIGNPFVPHAPNDLPAEDLCTEAATLNPPDGGQTITNDMTESAGDPVLACLWGNPSRPQGYRSVWYQFTPQQSGVVTIDTVGSSYDTALAVYDGDCASLNQLACNDDANGFASQVTVNVLAGRTYFVEAADWHAGVSGSAVLDLAAVLEVSTNWEIVGLMDVPRSRHEAIAIGNLLYVFAGQTVLGGNPVRTPRTDVYNAGSQTWTELAPMPAGVTPDGGGGYSNTTAAHLGGKVYFPSGYIGVDTVYDGTHWAYDIAQNVWHTNPPNDLWPTPTIYGTAVPYPQPLDPRYYYLGGLSGPLPLLGGEEPWAPHAEVYIYRPEGPLPWTAGPPMGTARFAHTAGRVPLNGSDHICVVGGISQSGVGDAILLSGGECYSLASESWDISLGALNYPRYNAGSALDVQGNWYIFGGTNAAGASVAVTELYDRASNSWV